MKAIRVIRCRCWPSHGRGLPMRTEPAHHKILDLESLQTKSREERLFRAALRRAVLKRGDHRHAPGHNGATLGRLPSIWGKGPPGRRAARLLRYTGGAGRPARSGLPDAQGRIAGLLPFPPALGLFFSPFLGLAPVFLLFPTPAFFLLEGNELLDLLQEGFDLFDSGFFLPDRPFLLAVIAVGLRQLDAQRAGRLVLPIRLVAVRSGW